MVKVKHIHKRIVYWRTDERAQLLIAERRLAESLDCIAHALKYPLARIGESAVKVKKHGVIILFHYI